MDLLNFPNLPKWEETQRDLAKQDKIKKTESDYWWIDDSELEEVRIDLNAFYDKCLKIFANIAQENSFACDFSASYANLLSIGQTVVFEYLYDRYLIQRHETDPDIFYNYVLQISFEAGITIANKHKENSSELHEYVDKIIQETSMDDISDICQQHFNVTSENAWLDFISLLSAPVYDLLKWYHNEDSFEEYKLALLLAAFQVGSSMILAKK